jgi:hypothetical protein
MLPPIARTGPAMGLGLFPLLSTILWRILPVVAGGLIFYADSSAPVFPVSLDILNISQITVLKVGEIFLLNALASSMLCLFCDSFIV